MGMLNQASMRTEVNNQFKSIMKMIHFYWNNKICIKSAQKMNSLHSLNQCPTYPTIL